MSQPDAWTVGRLLEWTTGYLKRHASENARLDAEVLLSESLGCQRIMLYASFADVPGEEVLTAFRELVRRRAEGEPVAYLVGHREFYSLDFRVTPDVLIPRPETEFLVLTLLDLARQRPRAGRISICDVGTGSGIIAVCAAKNLPDCKVTALDKSPEALGVAASNAAKHQVQERIEFIQSDLFSALAAQREFDFVVSNPPYVSQLEFDALSPDVRDFEPRDALLAGEQGTEIIERLIPRAAQRLTPGGHLLIEISPMIHDAVQKLIDADERLESGPTVKDLARLPRVVRAVRLNCE